MSNGLQAALLLARGRPEARDVLRGSGEALAVARRSFWAAAICLPAFLCLHLIDWAQAGPPARPGHALALDLLGYASGWAGFALVSHHIAAMLGRERQWPQFIAAWNWCSLVQYLMLVAAALPVLLGLPDMVCELVWLVALGWALWLEWFAARVMLDVPTLTAVGFVAFDIAIGMFIAGFTASLG
ncbi:MAG: hypothetical protein KGL55_02990 [Rhodospirillales bacterium]|nr:hypothetical protein [Rhodospirillales bacterium]